ncbi:hypothetical protein [Mesorhizobium sp. BE184]|uniref:hypothetical protein n=1 Tax=Mesorhizobium sp. BE184 TaxID=2817714 RepID=UPI002858E2EA|nr:hypothetical protein [Mesorhizobium sp. BE184]MDR7033458.1 hypothetical protein [Mesorhizobium sp. BE184]
MRKVTMLIAGAAMMMASAASAQQQPAPAAPSPAPTAPAAPSVQPAIKSVEIIDIEQLPAATKDQVNAFVAKSSDAELKRLRASIDGVPQIKSALEAKGMTSAQIVAASMGSDGP